MLLFAYTRCKARAHTRLAGRDTRRATLMFAEGFDYKVDWLLSTHSYSHIAVITPLHTDYTDSVEKML